MQRLYTFNGRVWAQRTVAATSNTAVYLQSNQLGSVVGIIDASGTLVDTMRYSPWGEQRNLTMSETTLNYTGQHRDNTALIVGSPVRRISPKASEQRLYNQERMTLDS
ncbi:MAG: hypothetical protein H0X37_16405 [Herpetosiphonaceae bacterium]|nr:hypothetical protein [Herpetosiphonaceae bacterium]